MPVMDLLFNTSGPRRSSGTNLLLICARGLLTLEDSVAVFEEVAVIITAQVRTGACDVCMRGCWTICELLRCWHARPTTLRCLLMASINLRHVLYHSAVYFCDFKPWHTFKGLARKAGNLVLPFDGINQSPASYVSFHSVLLVEDKAATMTESVSELSNSWIGLQAS